jgi:spore coat polysaccharide biosynthesis protein SpsF (cytidylyltransferase family)
MVKGLLTILAVRSESYRFPRKMLRPVEGIPLFLWVAQRLKRLGQVIVSTGDGTEDDALALMAKGAGFEVHRFPIGDVVGAMEDAVQKYDPQAEFVYRGLGDCPFLATELVERAIETMRSRTAEAFLWQLAPFCWPVYGAREFPFSRSGWEKIVSGSKERAHPDLYFHQHRSQFKFLLHEPPPNVYFRPYRLEVDWPEDLELAREVARGVGMAAPLADVIGWLDRNPAAAALNHSRVEITGPTISYPYELQREWLKQARGQPVLGWDNELWSPPTEASRPVFCNSGRCLLGWGSKGILHTKWGQIAGEANLGCDCGAGRRWIASGVSRQTARTSRSSPS